METIMGTVMPFPYGFVPKGWEPCNGQLLPISSNSAMFALIGTLYGGDGRTNFALPQLNGTNGQPGRVAAGQGQGPGLSQRVMGEMLGEDEVTLTASEMPVHTHGFALYTAGAAASAAPTAGATLMAPASNGYLPPPAAQPTDLSPSTVMPAGQNAPHGNDQPTLDLVYCICTQGIFPSFG
ncbi:MAG: tail fiber protein [Paracoccaceae bacterium]|nr:tail fiber protein [Paracoccaceae bacterium]MDE3240581.1 tail fiber protein [Paracoccaceae bacterium]